tara:strand:- start:1137 stop:1391 length:255 start_codon:yes stop_codon:yes gene_type:complete
MTRIVQSFSVPDGTIAHAKLKQWKEEGANISAIIQMLIEDNGQLVDHYNALKRKLRRVADQTRKYPHAVNKDFWELELSWWCDE